MEYQFFDDGAYAEDNLCISNFQGSRYDSDPSGSLVDLYKIGDGEDMCPRDYNLGVATQSWGRVCVGKMVRGAVNGASRRNVWQVCQ